MIPLDIFIFIIGYVKHLLHIRLIKNTVALLEKFCIKCR